MLTPARCSPDLRSCFAFPTPRLASRIVTSSEWGLIVATILLARTHPTTLCALWFVESSLPFSIYSIGRRDGIRAAKGFRARLTLACRRLYPEQPECRCSEQHLAKLVGCHLRPYHRMPLDINLTTRSPRTRRPSGPFLGPLGLTRRSVQTAVFNPRGKGSHSPAFARGSRPSV